MKGLLFCLFVAFAFIAFCGNAAVLVTDGDGSDELELPKRHAPGFQLNLVQGAASNYALYNDAEAVGDIVVSRRRLHRRGPSRTPRRRPSRAPRRRPPPAPRVKWSPRRRPSRAPRRRPSPAPRRPDNKLKHWGTKKWNTVKKSGTKGKAVASAVRTEVRENGYKGLGKSAIHFAKGSWRGVKEAGHREIWKNAGREGLKGAAKGIVKGAIAGSALGPQGAVISGAKTAVKDGFKKVGSSLGKSYLREAYLGGKEAYRESKRSGSGGWDMFENEEDGEEVRTTWEPTSNRHYYRQAMNNEILMDDGTVRNRIENGPFPFRSRYSDDEEEGMEDDDDEEDEDF